MTYQKLVTTLALICLTTVASKASEMTVVANQHRGFVRLSFPAKYVKSAEASGDGLHLVFPVPAKVGVRLPSTPYRSVASLKFDQGSIKLALVEGARGRLLRIGSQLVYDVFDPTPGSAPGRVSDPSLAVASGSSNTDPRWLPANKAAQLGAMSSSEASASASDPVKVEATDDRPGKQSAADAIHKELSAAPSIEEPGKQPTTVSLLAAGDGDVGVAVLKRGSRIILVFDKNIELSTDPSFTLTSLGASNQTLGTVSVITLDWPESAPVTLRRDRRGWSVSGEEIERPKRTFLGTRSTGQVELPFDAPGHVVSILDPDTDTPLLVGTILSTTGSNQSSHGSERAPGFSILPSEYGLFIEPGSDALELKPSTNGFVLSGGLLQVKEVQNQLGKPLTQRFDFAAVSLEGQLQRFNAQIASASAAPIRSRSSYRLAVAQTQISLGLGKEALATLRLAQTEDPAVGRNVEFKALLSIGALVSGQPSEGGDMASPLLDGSDDVDFWRGVEKAQTSKLTADVARLEAAMPLLMTYLPPLRDRFLPWVSEASLKNAHSEAYLALPESERGRDRLQFSKAMQLELSGHLTEAIAKYEEIGHGLDFRDQVRALGRLAELHVATGQIKPREASNILESQAFAWRGDELEVEFRLRSVKMLQQANAWRPALEALRALRALPLVHDDPVMVKALQQRTQDVLQAFSIFDARAITPVETVALLDDFDSEIGPGPVADRLQRIKAEKLLELEMPERAIPILSELRKRTLPMIETSEIGALLAQACLEAGRYDEAKQVLTASDGAGLPADLVERRSFVQARSEIMLDQPEVAQVTLASLHSTKADALRVELFASRKEWKLVTAALQDMTMRDVPVEGPLTDAQQDLIIRLVSAGVEAGLDDVTKATYSARIRQMSPARAKILTLLVSPSMTAMPDPAGVKQAVASAKDVSAYRIPPSP